MTLEHWELLSYVATVVGLLLAIFVFLFEQRKERENAPTCSCTKRT